MPCEHYKDALIEVAATGAAPQGELRAHVSECASCRTVFDQERSLFSAIDSSLYASANAEVPASLLPRVRAQLDEVIVPRFRWLQPLVFASAGVALAFAVFLVVRPHHVKPEAIAKQSPMVAPTPAAPATRPNPEANPPEGTQLAAIPVRHFHAARNSTGVHPAASGNVEVLVPPGTEAAFLSSLPRLLKDFEPSQQGQGGQAKSLEVAPLAIDEISSPPLSPDEKDSGPNGGVGRLRSLPMPAEFLRAQQYKLASYKVSG